MARNPDAALEALRGISGEFRTFCEQRGHVSEADTRAKVIDRILREVCGWPEDAITREDYVGRGYTDYVLSVHGRAFVTVEAKREGIPFVFPTGQVHRALSLSGSLLTSQPIREAVDQVRMYCDDAGIRHAIATNGYSWIIFRAIRDDLPWRKGSARIFPSLEWIEANFTEFWNLLSYEAVASGALDTEFGTPIRAQRRLYRVVDRLFNADLPLPRNRLHAQLHPLTRSIFEDIADQDQIEILQSCYVHSASLRIVASDLNYVIRDTIPDFLRDQGTEPLQQSHSDSGRFGTAIEDALTKGKGQLFLLLGGIGSGKTTFLKRYQRTVGKETLDKHTLWFHVDFLAAPLDPLSLEDFVWRSVLDDLRSRYSEIQVERRRNIKRAFADEIAALQETALAHLRPGSDEYERALSVYLQAWQGEVARYVPRLLSTSRETRNRSVVIFVDNVDQLSPSYQTQIFLLAQRITRTVGAITIVALREESYYAASVQRSFTAYTNRKFHIASPRFRVLIGSRINFALNVLEGLPGISTVLDSSGIALDKPAIADFLRIVNYSIFERNKNIARFIESVCFGNMRLALQMFTTFLSSGVTDVDKMLAIYRREGAYFVAFHEFVKSIMLGDRRYYKESASPIINVFECGAQKNASHFTGIRLLNLLLSFRGQSTSEGHGYLDLARAATLFEDVFDNKEDFITTADRLVRRQLIETNTRSTEGTLGASHVRVTSAGWYLARYLVRSFPYLDLVLQDTPLDDYEVFEALKEAVFKVDNLTDKEDDKLERLETRFGRVDTFLTYLRNEEKEEVARFNLAQVDSVLSQPIVSLIEAGYRRQKEWIWQRVKENRERFAEEVLLDNEPDEPGADDVYDDSGE